MAEIIKDQDLEKVDGGAAAKNKNSWENYAKGTFVNYGTYIVYTIAPGDVMSGIAIRFGVTIEEIATWNKIKDVNLIYAGQTLTIYPRVLR
ncbi:MAG: LysM peptidoglycan-binding domain-containing protein [Oscillospiraceae bacterium]|nr:LysM peptidoglycan-binding domain-containing protein [Oscillospiraceae bacterium]MBR6207500.1 LysM peptidoglycan-binding domain-containing protein [Oscillospiraceae bacterium]